MAKNQLFSQERHLTAARWERVRAGYFERCNKPDNATRCKLLAQNHIQAAKEAARLARAGA